MLTYRLGSTKVLALAALLVSVILLVPILVVVGKSLGTGQGAWQHLAATVLPDYIVSTLWLVLGVSIGVMLLGVSSAWLIATYRFPCSGVLEWALV